MATGELHLLGTLYTGGIKRLMPTNPTDVGNITPFVAGQAIEIRHTDADNTYKLRWREVSTDAGKILIADRNILHSVSWNELNTQGMVTGKEITIDGQKYKLRLLTGGSNYRSGTDAYSGGSPAANEWDHIITNEANHAGLPKPVAADLVAGPNKAGVHNQFWNWASMYSWGREVFSGNGSNRVLRGYNSARFWGNGPSSNLGTHIGFRPVLELLEPTPDIYVNINGTHRKAESVHVNVNGVWRKADSIHTNINGIWRKS